MKRITVAVLLSAASIVAHSSCLSVADNAETIAQFRDSGNTPAQTKAVLASTNPSANDDRQYESAITDAIYQSKVKPWNASALALSVCDPKTASDGLSEKQRETNYRDSFNRIQSIPGVCTGEDCNHVVKIQRWDANGNMVN